jgi:hypothetical protein
MRLDWNGFSEALPRDEKLIFKHVRDFVLATEPTLIESKSYGVPYYSRHKRNALSGPYPRPMRPKRKTRKMMVR